MRFRPFAVVLCFAAVDITYGGSFYFPDCLNAGSTTVIRPISPCAQIYNQLNSQVQPNMQQAGFYQQKSQMIDGREQLQRMASTDNSQNNQFQNLYAVSRADEGKGDERGRFRREIPYQVPYRATEYNSNYYNPYQGSNMIEMLAELYSQRLGVQKNAYQQAGFNQFVAPQYSQRTVYPFQYNANNQPPYWLNGYGFQPGQNFQNPSMPVSGGLQMTNQNMYGDAYPSISQYNQMGGFTRYPNYPQSGYSNPVGRCTSAACGVVPVCAINCQSSVSPEAQQSQWMDYGQLKQRLAEYASMLNIAQQSAGRNLGKSDVVTQAVPVNVQTTSASSEALKLGTEPTPRISPTEPPMKQEISNSQRVLGLKAPEVSIAEPPKETLPSPTTPSPISPSPSTVDFMPSAATSEHLITSQTQPTPLLQFQVTPSSSSLTYAQRSEDEPLTPKPVRASRSILEE